MISNICCIGAGYVGGPTMTVIADRCPNILINVVDTNAEKIKAWNSEDLNKLPVFEPGLRELIKKVRNKNLFFSSDIDLCIKNADAIFISVNTPIKTSGLGAGEASDLKWVEASARRISENANGHTIVIEKSTLPVRTAKVIKEILSTQEIYENDNERNKSFSVLSNPEFLAEGTAIKDLQEPDRVLIGGDDKNAILELKKLYLNWVDEHKIITTNLWSSELSKLTANAFLAQRISSINSISAICEATGADIKEVAKATGLDSRIGLKFLKAGPGFGGSCFKKDILNLVYLCKYFNLRQVGDFWEQVIKINEWQRNRIYEIIVKNLFGNISDKKILILGFSFKANTNDTRESPTIGLSINLLKENANLVFHDPQVSFDQIKNELEKFTDLQKYTNQISFCSNLYNASDYADAIIIMTEWKEYELVDWEKITKKMRKPSWVFDARGILDISKIRTENINIWQVGNGVIKN